MKTLQERLRSARKTSALTQAELSVKSGLSQSTIAQIESGRNSGTKFADRLAEALNVPLNWLLTGEGEDGAVPLVPNPRRRAMDADEWLFLDLVEPRIDPPSNKIEWKQLERGALRIHRSFFRGKNVLPENCKVLLAHGESMKPFLFDGDWFVLDTTITDFRDGITAFIRDNGDTYVIQVRRLPNGGIRLSEAGTQERFEFGPGEAERTLRPIGGVIYRTTPATYEYQLK